MTGEGRQRLYHKRGQAHEFYVIEGIRGRRDERRGTSIDAQRKARRGGHSWQQTPMLTCSDDPQVFLIASVAETGRRVYLSQHKEANYDLKEHR